MAGHESATWHPLVSDFILVGQKLKKLGFVYSYGEFLLSKRAVD